MVVVIMDQTEYLTQVSVSELSTNVTTHLTEALSAWSRSDPNPEQSLIVIDVIPSATTQR